MCLAGANLCDRRIGRREGDVIRYAALGDPRIILLTFTRGEKRIETRKSLADVIARMPVRRTLQDMQTEIQSMSPVQLVRVLHMLQSPLVRCRM